MTGNNNPIRFAFSYLFASFFLCFGFVRRAKKRAASGKFITSVYFHNPTKKLFEKCVVWLLKNDYTFISVDDLAEILEKKKTIPAKAVLFTLDDAYQNNISNVFEIAEKYKIPVTIFAPTESVEHGEYWPTYVFKGIKYASKEFKSIEDFKKIPEWKRKEQIALIKKHISIEREAMTIDELKMVSRSPFVCIGSHTVNHPCTVNCSAEELEYELKV